MFHVGSLTNNFLYSFEREYENKLYQIVGVEIILCKHNYVYSTTTYLVMIEELNY